MIPAIAWGSDRMGYYYVLGNDQPHTLPLVTRCQQHSLISNSPNTIAPVKNFSGVNLEAG